MSNSADLPVMACLPTLRAALARGNAVLVAPPGAGKTSLVPPALLDAPWLGGQRVVMLEPRRLAARAAATRMAALAGEPVGETFGYRTRLDSAVSPATRVEVVTEGLLVRRLQGDPGLSGIGCVIFDEVHERALEADLALALCLELQRGLRPELRLLAMSATAETARLVGLLGAELVQSEGRQHPVTVSHAARDLAHPRDLPDALARAVRAELANGAGDVLAFLPGMAEIRRAMAALDGCGAVVLPLHGDLAPAEQERALRPDPGGRRVVLATSIAETSLTVPGVRVVVDGGFRRAPMFDPGRGLTRLDTRRISRAAAEQRAGRAGREAPGRCVRLWTTAQHRGLPPFDPPEILAAELSGLVLDCAAWGAAPSDLPFLDPPPTGAVAAAETLLQALGALDEARRLTERGRRMAALGAAPRLAAMLLEARDPAEQALAAALAAILEERDPLRGEADSVDIALRLGRLSPVARRAAAQYGKRLGLSGEPAPRGDAARLIAAGFPDRIAQRRGEPGSFRLSGGGGARLPVADPLARSPLLAVAAMASVGSAAGGGAAQIRLAAALTPESLPEAVLARVSETTERVLDPAGGTVLLRRRRRFGALVLEDRTETAPAAEASEMLAASLAVADLPWTDEARQLQARIALMRGVEGDAWPDCSDAALIADREWLATLVDGCRSRQDVARVDVAASLRMRLGGRLAARLEHDLPSHLALPGGRAAVDYTAPVPVAAARAQAFFGLRETPTLAGGRVALRLALLSPAGRPVAITGDLSSFWQNGWADVRRDMRGRYPRHPWPENPAAETPSRR